jgi:hypothetical protein
MIGRLSGQTRRDAFLASAVVWGTLLALGAELLSYFDRFEIVYLAIYWGTITVACIICIAILMRRGADLSAPGRSGVDRTSLILLGVLGVQVILILVIALSAPPNNSDSMSCHMARAAHWVQHKCVAHHSTHNPTQLFHKPWAAFAISHFQILAGGDRFANLVQWLAMAGCLLAVSLLAKQMGADPGTQVAATVFAGALPMGILQASSTQSDYATAFWLVCFASYAMKLIYHVNGAPTAKEAALAGLSLGLAVLTKGTAYPLALPFAAWLGVKLLKSRSWKCILIVSVTALALNLGHYERNCAWYGNPWGPAPGKWGNEVWSLQALASNVSKNLALQIVTPVKSLNQGIERAVRAFHRHIGYDIDDRRTSLGFTAWAAPSGPTTESYSFWLPTLVPYENLTANPIHFLLIIAAVCVFLFVKPRNAQAAALTLCIVAAFLVFCALVKWQVWNSRLLLPLFVLSAPAVAVAAEDAVGRRGIVPASALLLAAALPWVLLNQTRPLLALDLLPQRLRPAVESGSGKWIAHYRQSVLTESRSSLMFREWPEMRGPFEGAAGFVASCGCRRVGLFLAPQAWEYPLWDMLKRGPTPPIIEHFAVPEAPGFGKFKRPTPAFSPDCIICFHKELPPLAAPTGGAYRVAWSSAALRVLVRTEEDGGSADCR